MLKNMLISFASILGVFLVLFLVWFFVLNDSSTTVVNTDVEVSHTPVAPDELEDEDTIEPPLQDQSKLFESNLKIISVD